MWIACAVWCHFYYQIYYYDLYVKSVESGHKAKSILFWTLKGLGLFIVVVFGQYFIIKLNFSIFTSTDKNPPQTFTCCYSLVSGDGHYHHLRHAQRPTNHCLPVWSSLCTYGNPGHSGGLHTCIEHIWILKNQTLHPSQMWLWPWSREIIALCFWTQAPRRPGQILKSRTRLTLLL